MEGLENGDSQLNTSDPHQHLDSFEATASHDDFLEQMLSTLPNCTWPDLSSNPNPNPNPKSNNNNNKSPWDNNHNHNNLKSQDDDSPQDSSFPSFEDLSSKLRLHPLNNNNAAAAKASMLLQQQQHQLLLSRAAGDAAGLMPFPLTLASATPDMMHADTSSFKSTSPPLGADQPLYNAFPGPLHGNGQPPFQAGGKPGQSFGGPGAAVNGAPASASTGGSGQAPQRQRVRARRGQATDPHSIAERLRRERIAERMKALQELVPNGNKTDKASMLDEIIDYVKFLQLQVKVLSMSRLGGAGAMAPRVADLSSEGGSGGGVGRSSNAGQGGGTAGDTMTVTEHQVAKLMEEDMGSAMQYLQGKGLCLMPISLATAISTATCHTRTNTRHHPPPPNGSVPPANANGDRPTSPNLSGLTVQSANLINGDASAKDSNPASNAQ